MSDGEIVCNFKKCLKPLKNAAYITRCSHAFCEDHGNCEQFSQMEKRCPACSSSLTQKMDLVRVNLNPSNEFKAMVLAGLQPEIIMDIATRGIMFWIYQQYQQYLQKDMTVKNLKDILSTTKNEAKAEAAHFQTEIANLKRRVEDLEKELGSQTAKFNETCEKLAEKLRENQKLQLMNEALKRKNAAAVMMYQQHQQQQHSQQRQQQCSRTQQPLKAPIFDIDIEPAGPRPAKTRSPQNNWMFSRSPPDNTHRGPFVDFTNASNAHLYR